MDTFEAIYSRRSIRNFVKGKHIPEDALEEIMESSRYVLPSPMGSYLWKIVMVREDETVRNLLADAAKEVARVMFGASFEVFGPGHLWYMPKDTQLAVAEYSTTGELWTYPREADVVFVPVISKGAWSDTSNIYSSYMEYWAQYVGFATQNMWLIGHSLGIGSAYNGMPLLDTRRRELVEEYLGVPSSCETTGAYCFGYADRPRYFGPARPPIEGVTFSEYWGRPYRRIAFSQSASEEMKLPETDLREVIHNLNFVESFADEPIPQWMVEKAIDAAIWGPVPENFKNWRFIIIKDKESKEFLAELVNEKKGLPFQYNWPELQYARASYLPEEQRLEKVEEFYTKDMGGWLKEADTLILVLSCYDQWRDQPYAICGVPGRLPMLNISTGCCIQNMFVAATALGLGMNYDILAAGGTASRDPLLWYFGIPATSWCPQGIVGLGKPGKKLDLPPKPPLETLICDEYWGRPHKSRS